MSRRNGRIQGATITNPVTTGTSMKDIPPMLDLRWIRQFTGMSQSWLKLQIDKGTFPPHDARFGRKRKWYRATFLRWLECNEGR